MTEPLTITIPAVPTRTLSPNGRVHWGDKRRAVQAARDIAFYAAQNWSLACPQHRPPWRHRAIRVGWIVRWGKGQKRWDDDNLAAGLKPFQDGLCDALGIDDRRFRLGGIAQERDPDGRGCVVVTLTPEEG